MQTVMRKPIRRAAVLHDLCAVGKAAMTNILPVLSVMGIEVCPVPTMVLSAHTGGFGKPVMRYLKDFPKECAGHLKEQGLAFDAVFVGYLGNRELVEGAKAFLKTFPCELVLFDPIMADHGRFYSNFDAFYGELLKELIPFCTVMTPNYTESCLLTGEPCEPVCSNEKLHRMAERFRSMGSLRAVITSVPVGEDRMALGIVDAEREEWLPYQTAGRAYPGTGDIFSSVLLGSLLKGNTLHEAAWMAHSFVADCIQRSDEAGYETREGVLLEPQLLKLAKFVP